jgi:hypothetical protein
MAVPRAMACAAGSKWIGFSNVERQPWTTRPEATCRWNRAARGVVEGTGKNLREARNATGEPDTLIPFSLDRPRDR